MADMEYERSEHGTVHIADEVIQIIAGLATSEVEGVAGMSGSLAGGLTESLTGRKNLAKGVKVQFTEDDRSCVVEISVVLQFGVNIPDTSFHIQERVKESIESMTGLTVDGVNVRVVGVVFQSEKDKLTDADHFVGVEHSPQL
ncbi:Asp23/Gls24 family envelope stress response protein [Alicyclobacillus dauci]|uniref:Asp23/Gls24 family envelope stress response protein n=1 Tax=Alicyclobacillus dauci TaxID=1475485 RepID=A0ABY6Z803_9BACL|nr:Asp23/Gls24 family envelope stress response protein [Alicyclobacillus dauci]WAH39004.1 Asp23/Gls24 family envelope stress response protein [Alicyclobacillus dauci]